jgi:predicted RNase H-like nuclease
MHVVARVGVDGCKNGWFFFCLEDSELQFGVVSHVQALIESVADESVVFIDIPIGLRTGDEGERLCDLKARQVLSPARGSSVFPVPCRQAVYASSYEEASAQNQRVLGKGLSKQSWAIASKIREVDTLLRSSRRARSMVREVHPEVCFWGLSGAPMQHSKKTREGFEERMAVLASILPGAFELVEAAFLEHGGFEANRDDVLDALVAALCAVKVEACQTLSEAPESDREGLPMEMVYLPAAAL